MLDLVECQSLDANKLPSEVYLSPVQNQQPSYDGSYTFVFFGVRQAQIFGCACPKHKGGKFTQNKGDIFFWTKFRIRETLNLSTCAASSTDTKII